MGVYIFHYGVDSAFADAPLSHPFSTTYLGLGQGAAV